MATLKAANITKYDAGGTGDNYISDGFIKTVEKVWLDSYTATAVALGSDDSICIGYVEKNKKITDIIVQMPALSEDEGSYATIFLCTGASVLMTAASTYFGALKPDTRPQAGAWDMLTAATLRLEGSHMGAVTPIRVGVYMKVMTNNGIDVGLTGGTIRTIIKYT